MFLISPGSRVKILKLYICRLWLRCHDIVIVLFASFSFSSSFLVLILVLFVCVSLCVRMCVCMIVCLCVTFYGPCAVPDNKLIGLDWI